VNNLQFILLSSVIVVAAFVLVRVLKILNSPDGERYQKMRMQGPFVPLDPEDDKATGNAEREDKRDDSQR
jgi:hypothetical protein